MDCKICGKKIVLIPSAEERSRKYGMPASFYTALFDTHPECALAKRKEDTSKLMAAWGLK